MKQAQADAGEAQEDRGVELQDAAPELAEIFQGAEEDIDRAGAPVVGLVGFGFRDEIGDFLVYEEALGSERAVTRAAPACPSGRKSNFLAQTVSRSGQTGFHLTSAINDSTSSECHN